MASGSNNSRDRVTIASYSEETLLGVSEGDVWAMNEGSIDCEARCEAAKIPSTMTIAKLAELTSKYYIPSYIELLVPEANEHACYPRAGCVAVSKFLFKVRIRLPLHPFLG